MDTAAETLGDLWKLVMKRRAIIAVIFAATVAIAAVVSFLKPNVYRGEAVFRLVQGRDVFSAKEVVDINGHFSRDGLNRLFPQHAAHLHAIRLTEVSGSPDKFRVVIDSERPDEMNRVAADFMAYLNQNPLLVRKVEEASEVLKDQFDDLTIVIADAVRMQVAFSKMLDGGKMVAIGFNPVELEKRISDLKLERTRIRNAIRRNLVGVDQAQSVLPSSVPVAPKRVANIAIAGVWGLLGGFSVALLLGLLERARQERGRAS